MSPWVIIRSYAQGVEDNDTVNCRCETASLVNNEFESVSARSHERNCRSVEFRRRNACRTSTLDRSPLLDSFRTTEKSEFRSISSGSDEDKKRKIGRAHV